MPFKAMLDGREVVSFLMTDEEWSECLVASKEDQSRLVMPVTGVPCFGRPSSRGWRHFVHRSGFRSEGETDSESWQHRMLKKLVAEQALSMGWEVDVEVPAPGGEWVADTMMIKGDRRVVIEAQWSQQSLEEYQRRQQRYTEAGIECWWITRHDVNKAGGLRGELPMVPLAMDRFKENEEFIVRVKSKQLTIAELVIAILDQWFVEEEIGELMMYPYSCWRCHTECVMWRCLWLPFVQWEEDKPENSPWVRRIVEGRMRPVGVPLAVLQLSFTKATGKEYMAFSCPGCKAVLGDNFLLGDAEERRWGSGDSRYKLAKVLTGVRAPLQIGNPRLSRVPDELTPGAWTARTFSQEDDSASSSSASVSVGLTPQQIIRKMFRGAWP